MPRRTFRILLVGLIALTLAGRAEAEIGAWTTGGPPFGGLGMGARAVAIDPQSPATVYVATAGGVFKSADGGQSWAPRSNGLEGSAPLAVAVDPKAPGTLYAGMNADAVLGGGVFKSTDGAGNWTRMNNGLPMAPFVNVVQALAVDPATPTTLYAGPGSFGVYKSTDGGLSWAAVNNGIPAGTTALVLAIDPASPSTVYAGTTPGGVYRSTDGGATWVARNAGVPPGETFAADLAIDPATPSTLYRASNSSQGVYRSTNGGGAWAFAGAGLPAPVTFSAVRGLAVDPLAPSTLYAVTTSSGVWRSTDGGESWAPMSQGLPGPVPSFRAIAISPSGACLHAAALGVFDFATRADPCVGGGGPPPLATTLVAAVLPASRSVRVATAATAFVTVINTGTNPAAQVGIVPAALLPATLVYRTTSCATNAVTGGVDVPVDIPAGGAQCYVIAVTPGAPFGPQDVPLDFVGTNTAPVGVLPGVNTLLLSGNATPTPDIVAVAATVGNDGIVGIPGATGTGVFAVAVSNVGITATITVTADTGATALPVIISVCETDAAGACKLLPASSVSTVIPGGITAGAVGTATYGVFVTGNGSVGFDPAANRVFVRFLDLGNVTRGATSVAVRTQ